MPALADDLSKTLKDAVYITVGLGVIAFQKAQVQRQELRRQLSSQFGEARSQLDTFSKVFEDRVKLVEERLDGMEDRFEDLIDQFEDRLPEQAKDLAKQARIAARDATGQLRDLVARRRSAA